MVQDANARDQVWSFNRKRVNGDALLAFVSLVYGAWHMTQHKGKVHSRRAGRTNAKETCESQGHRYCCLPKVPERVFGPNVSPERARLILEVGSKWVNGTPLHYYFFDRESDGEDVTFEDGTKEWITWVGGDEQKAMVRKGFEVWKELAIGLEFLEVPNREDAEVRIAFMSGDGYWSYIGKDILKRRPNERTMNFDPDLTQDRRGVDVPVHEIGHTIGLPHEHQNPFAGIVWNEEAVYNYYAQPPNAWKRETTHYNIIKKLEPRSMAGSKWDPDSIMHYPFAAGLIKKPEKYAKGLTPAGGISPLDQQWALRFYPPLRPDQYPEIEPMKLNKLDIAPGDQTNFVFVPDETRYFEMRTFGKADCHLVLFAGEDDKNGYCNGADDTGEEGNAYLRARLTKGQRYILRVRLIHRERGTETALMVW